MSLIRYQSPVSTFSSLIDSFFDPWERSVPSKISPKVDVIEEKDSFRLLAEIPGMDKKDISVEVLDGVLSISGEKKEEKFEKDRDRYYHFERTSGSFRREFRLSEDVDPEKIEAKYTNGILELTLKKTEKAKPKQFGIAIE